MLSLAAWILTGCGVALVLIGLFFLAARPPLLPEDARVMGSTVNHILAAVPALSSWLRRVFWVLGGYIATTGVLVVYIANTGVRAGNAGALAVLAVAAVTSIGWMAAVNFMIRSDFSWALLGLTGIWYSDCSSPRQHRDVAPAPVLSRPTRRLGPGRAARSAGLRSVDADIGGPGHLDGVPRTLEWEPSLRRLAAAGLPIILAEGRRDPAPVPGQPVALASAAPTLRHLTHPHATHLMPQSEGDWGATLITTPFHDGRPAQ